MASIKKKPYHRRIFRTIQLKAAKINLFTGECFGSITCTILISSMQLYHGISLIINSVDQRQIVFVNYLPGAEKLISCRADVGIVVKYIVAKIARYIINITLIFIPDHYETTPTNFAVFYIKAAVDIYPAINIRTH